MVALLALSACNGDNGDDEGELPEAQTLMVDSAQNLDSASAFQLELRQSGTPTVITESLGVPITFSRAQAVFVSPDRLSALVNVAIDALTQEVELVIVGADQFANNRFITAGKWQEFTFASGFNGADLQSEAKGIGTALRNIQNLEMVGRDEINGINVYHVRGQVEANQVRSITVGLIGNKPGLIAIEVYIRSKDSYPARIVIREPILADGEGTPEDTIWTIDFSGFNRDDLVVNAPDDPLPPGTPDCGDDCTDNAAGR